MGVNLDDFSDVVPGGINANSSSIDEMGFPSVKPIGTSASNLVQTNPNTTSNGGFIDSLEAYFGNSVGAIKNSSESLIDSAGEVIGNTFQGIGHFGDEIIHDTESGIKKAYGGVKTVVGDVVSGVEDIGGGIFNRMLLWVIVCGGIVYLIARTNNFKANISIPTV